MNNDFPTFSDIGEENLRSCMGESNWRKNELKVRLKVRSVIMKPKMCILYLGVNCDHNDVSGDGGCLDYTSADGTVLPCREAIEKGSCVKKRTTPIEK